MSTYVISDIHGHLTIFKKLLKTINFSFDNDELFLLGDYVDWGKESLETLLYVMELDKKYKNVHVLIGNHDLMFLQQIQRYNKNNNYIDKNWIYRNDGQNTWNQYLEQKEENKKNIEKYLDTLPYRAEIIVNGKKFLMAHACPREEYICDETLTKEENYIMMSEIRADAVWTRIINYIKYVAKWYSNEENKYDYFICGHTISHIIKDNHISINANGDTFQIDCGAKILGKKEFEEEKFARLSALRLEDFKEFYEQ